jgi:putative membrane protein
MHAMLRDHNEVVPLVRRYSKNGRDSDFRSWAARTLPTLEEHRQMAKSLYGRLGGVALGK